MPDHEKPQNNEQNGNSTAPTSLPNSQIPSDGNENPNPPYPKKRTSDNDKRPSYKTLWKEIRWLDLINAGVAIAMLIVAIAAYKVASDTRDIKSAVADLGALAKQTAREAKALESQLVEVQKQTKFISDQTDALKASATAQQEVAKTTKLAEKPRPDLSDVSISNLTPDRDGIVLATVRWEFRDVGGGPYTAKNVRFGISVGPVLPAKMPPGVVIDAGDAVVLNSITSALSLKNPAEFKFAKADLDRVRSGNANIFFFALLTYADVSGVRHTKCFGRKFFISGVNSTGSVPSGGSAYRCDT